VIRLYIESFDKNTSAIEISPDQLRYLTSVMRVKSGDCVRIFNEQNGEFEAVVEIKKKIAFVLPGACVKQKQANETTQEIWLAFSPLRNHVTHFVIEKATELGVTHIQPIISDYTQHRHVDIDKYKKITIEAAEQCERLSVPNIFEAKHFSDFIKMRPQIHWLAAIERTNSPLISLDAGKKESVGVIIGPEGGFSEMERCMLERSVTIVSLGNSILRSETAALFALSIINLQMSIKNLKT
jgi:16S rRNA (uracil1498-N3)-methyltransferase